MTHAPTRTRPITLSIACALALLIVGCGEGLQNDPAMGVTLPDVAPGEPANEEPPVQEPPLLEAEPEAAALEVINKVSLQEYAPPFPDRNNLFAPAVLGPRRSKASSSGDNASVVLMGFANVHEPKVVLAIDGIVSPLAGGETYAGVEVISIAPPSVVLQRGRNRWTASFE